MQDLILRGIAPIVEENKDLLRIAIRQKAKFEGWLKFELAHYLEKHRFGPVVVESEVETGNGRSDVTFMLEGKKVSVELKTSNTNWKTNGVESKGKPLTKNVDSIIKDALKHNSDSCVIAFVLFPIPFQDLGWIPYINRIISEAGVQINRETNCRLIEVDVNDVDKCQMLICSFLSKKVERVLQGMEAQNY